PQVRAGRQAAERDRTDIEHPAAEGQRLHVEATAAHRDGLDLRGAAEPAAALAEQEVERVRHLVPASEAAAEPAHAPAERIHAGHPTEPPHAAHAAEHPAHAPHAGEAAHAAPHPWLAAAHPTEHAPHA